MCPRWPSSPSNSSCTRFRPASGPSASCSVCSDSLVALGLALIQRANRILNFAQADLGTVPTAFAYGCITSSWALPYLLSFAIGLVGAAIIGALVEFLLIRRFFKSSRLVLTVATIGISQLFLVISLLIPRIWGASALESKPISFPFHTSFSIGTQLFSTDDLVALAISIASLVALALFLGRSDIGVAVRASAERADRAASLGIPVKRINTLVWSIAATLSYLGVFLRASILGLAAGGQPQPHLVDRRLERGHPGRRRVPPGGGVDRSRARGAENKG